MLSESATAKMILIERQNLQQFVKFSMIGAINTLIHIIITISIVELLHFHPIVANSLAFLSANMFSYWANSRWSFRTKLSGMRFVRFVTISIVGLLITVGGSGLAEIMNWHYLVGVAIVVCALPILTFVLHKYWTFSSI